MNDASAPPVYSPRRIGFGVSGPLGMTWFPEREAARLVAAAVEGGIRRFDTAGFYADGEAERRLGAALRDIGEPVFVSTKTGTRYRRFGPPRKDFSERAIRADAAASLRRLGRAQLDLLYLHGPSDAELLAARPVLEALKRAGDIARWGVCGEGAGLDAALAAGADEIMGAFNFLRPAHVRTFRGAKAKGAGVVAIAPLAQGLYARGFFRIAGPADAWRVARALVKNRAELSAARRASATLEGAPPWTPAQLAMAFALAEPSVDAAIMTTTRPAHLREILEPPAGPPPDAILSRLGVPLP